MVRYLVSGCGISVVCDDADAVVSWMKEFVERGGIPVVAEVEL